MAAKQEVMLVSEIKWIEMSDFFAHVVIKWWCIK